MKYLYDTLQSTFIFYFIAILFQDIMILGNNEFSDYLVPGIIFGVIIASLPFLLTFFKLGANTGSIILGSVVIVFMYYFIGYYFLDLFAIAASGSVDFGIDFLKITTQDQTIGLILLSIFSASLNVIMQLLNVQK